MKLAALITAVLIIFAIVVGFMSNHVGTKLTAVEELAASSSLHIEMINAEFLNTIDLLQSFNTHLFSIDAGIDELDDRVKTILNHYTLEENRKEIRK